MSKRKLATLAILGFLFVSQAGAQTDKKLLGNAFLVRGPGYYEECTKGDSTQTIGINNEHLALERSERYWIVTHSHGVAEATLIGFCEPSNYVPNNLFILSSRKPIDWNHEYDALLTLRGINPDNSKVGSVSPMTLNASQRNSVLKTVRNHIPPTDKMNIEAVSAIHPSAARQEYLFVAVSHYDKKNYEGAGDKAIKGKGFLFLRHRSELRLLLLEDYLQTIYTITDIDGDGVYELLVHSGDWGGGSYELRFFDGVQFNNEKLVLYEWSH